MSSEVFVRFVPKNKSAVPRSVSLESLAPKSAKSFTPDAKRAGEAQKRLQQSNVTALQTPGFRLETKMTTERFKELFAQDAQFEFSPKGKVEAPPWQGRLTKHEGFMKPAAALKIPDSLTDVIDFAYVPRPVEYFADSYIPPLSGTYHLRLSDVVHAVNASRCHLRGWRGQGIKVAMADSGFFPHKFFDRAGYNIVRLNGPQGGNPQEDHSGHGTGESANVLAIAPEVTLVCVRQGSSAAGDLETALGQNPDVMTNSWGWSIDTESKQSLSVSDPNMFNEMLDIETIIADAVSRDVTVCFSAGNGHYSFPGCLPQVISVGGVMVNANGSIGASNYASSFVSQLYPGRRVPDLCGIVGSATADVVGKLPGHIMLPVPPGSQLDGRNMDGGAGLGWGVFSGTSAASPQLAGVVALMKCANRKLTPSQIREILQSAATDVDTGQSAMGDLAAAGADAATGAGFVDALKACEQAVAMV